MPKIINASYINDPGHGWLSVDHQVILDLGIKDEISGFSYMSASKVYLEEDSDFSKLIVAAVKAGWRVEEDGFSSGADRDGDEWVWGYRKNRYPVGSGVVDVGYGRGLDTSNGKIVPLVSVADAVKILRIKSSHSNSESKVRSYGRYRADLVGALGVGGSFILSDGREAKVVKRKGAYLIVSAGGSLYQVNANKVTNYAADPVEVEG